MRRHGSSNVVDFYTFLYIKVTVWIFVHAKCDRCGAKFGFRGLFIHCANLLKSARATLLPLRYNSFSFFARFKTKYVKGTLVLSDVWLCVCVRFEAAFVRSVTVKWTRSRIAINVSLSLCGALYHFNWTICKSKWKCDDGKLKSTQFLLFHYSDESQRDTDNQLTDQSTDEIHENKLKRLFVDKWTTDLPSNRMQNEFEVTVAVVVVAAATLNTSVSYVQSVCLNKIANFDQINIAI